MRVPRLKKIAEQEKKNISIYPRYAENTNKMNAMKCYNSHKKVEHLFENNKKVGCRQ